MWGFKIIFRNQILKEILINFTYHQLPVKMSKLLIYLVLNYVYFEGEENFSTTPHFVPKIFTLFKQF